MRRTIFTLALLLTCSLIGQAQKAETESRATTNTDGSVSAGKAGKSIDIKSGTRLAAELQNTIDVRKAKVGDEVILKTTQSIKAEGQTVVNKGARLIGHVSEVERTSHAKSESRIGLIFDRLEKGALAVPITATISSITSGRASARAGDQDLLASEAGASSTTSTRTSSGQGGGLVGGVASTVGGVANTTVSTVSETVAGTTAAVGSTVNSTDNTTAGLSRSLGRIEISESTSTSAEGGSVLSLRGDNLRLEKGTHFNLVINQSGSVGTNEKP